LNETQYIVGPLEQYKTKIASILSEYPEHPVLITLVRLADRITGLVATTPLMKVLKGFELLLEKSQEWELYASKSLSIAEQLAVITSIILRWRKIELKNWPQMMSSKEQDHEKKSAKWWFQIYRAVSSACNLPQDSTSLHQSFFESMETFIQSSSIGEFKHRLGMLYSFHLQMISERDVYGLSTTSHSVLSNILLNVYHHYQQFLPSCVAPPSMTSDI